MPVWQACISSEVKDKVLGFRKYCIFLSDLQSQMLHFDGADTGSRASILWTNRCVYTFENIIVR